MPFLHFFDGFRTSPEINTIELIDDDVLRQLVPEALVRSHRSRALSPEQPFIARFRGSELLFALATTAAVLVFDILYGVLAAVGLSLADLLRRVARPHDGVLGYVSDVAGVARRRRLPHCQFVLNAEASPRVRAGEARARDRPAPVGFPRPARREPDLPDPADGRRSLRTRTRTRRRRRPSPAGRRSPPRIDVSGSGTCIR